MDNRSGQEGTTDSHILGLSATNRRLAETRAKPRDSTGQRSSPLCLLCTPLPSGLGTILTVSGSKLASNNGIISNDELKSDSEPVSDNEFMNWYRTMNVER